jgi:hypothetical protein
MTTIQPAVSGIRAAVPYLIVRDAAPAIDGWSGTLPPAEVV